ncbi:MAG: hypothetical protein HFJ95_09685 [Muribaculaceae bacterium]|nr:hypothetical protein [Muribaculaceae bacterium]
MKKSLCMRLWIAVVMLATFASCTEEEDGFIPDPTPTSTFIRGVARTSNGQPLPGVIVSFDYIQTAWLSGTKITHKSISKTNKNGEYTLFFEVGNDIKDSDDGVNRYYSLIFDAGNLSDKEYLIPSVFQPDNKSNQLSYNIGNNLKESVTYNCDFYIPRKKMLTVTVENDGDFDTDDRFAVYNSIPYGIQNIFTGEGEESDVKYVNMSFPVTLEAGRSQDFQIPGALDASNVIALRCLKGGVGSYTEVSESRELYVTSQTNEPVRLEYKYMPEIPKFEFYMTMQTANVVTSPFELVTFCIIDKEHNWSPLLDDRYKYYDSIVWDSSLYPGSLRVYMNESGADGTQQKSLSQWSTYFYNKGVTRTRLRGYRDGKVVHSDSMAINLHPRDFLCFDWAKTDISLTESNFTAYCLLDKSTEFIVEYPQIKDNTLFSKVSVKQMDYDTETEYAEKSLKKLEELMEYYFGNAIQFTSETIASNFHQLPENMKPVKFYQSSATNALIVKRTGDEFTQDKYFIYAEKR